jgi:large subunit ribosomal protein L25
MTNAITAVKRDQVGKRSRDVREAGQVPAVMYGRGFESRILSVPRSEFLRVFKSAGHSSLVDVAIESNPAIKVLIKEVQVDPLTLEPMHVDLQQVRMDEEITATIPLKFVGESVAVKEEGGTLVKSLDELEIKCLPGNLPHDIEVDLSKLATFEDAITVADLKLPAGVTVISDSKNTIATVARPMTEEEFKKLEEAGVGDVTAIKTEAEEKKAAEEAAAAAEGEAPAAEEAKPKEAKPKA